MSKEKSIYDGLELIYAEQLKNKSVTLTIKGIQGGVEFYNPSGKQKGFNISFEETDKKFGVAGSTVRRQLFMATGTENPDEMVGKKITLYPVKSTRSATGQAIRVKVPERNA